MKRLLLVTSLLAFILTAYAQSDRVGVAAAGNNLSVRPEPCSTNSLGTLQSGMDGAVNGTSQTCNNQSWQPARWTNGLQGWSAQGTGSTLYLIPLPGSGVFPNVNAPMAYPVRVGPDAAALNVRSGPGTNFSIITSKATGSTGWAFEAFNQTGTNIVWWKIRWDDGIVGWSAEGVRGSGIYLTQDGTPRAKFTLIIETLGTPSVDILVNPSDLNNGSSVVSVPANLVYFVGETFTLTAPNITPNGSTFTRWVVNGTPHTQRTLTLRQSQTARVLLIYSRNLPATENQFLNSLLAPWRVGQIWLPSTYDSHAGGNPLFAVDFNRVSSARTTCPYQNGFLQDCNEPVLASHWGKVYTRAQSGCTGYGNYAIVVSNVRQAGTSNSYLGTIYAHLNYFLKPNGATVNGGDPIGRVGSTGSSTGPHLHYEVRYFTVSGSTVTLGTRLQVLNNPAIRLSGVPLQVDLNCSVSGLGYGGQAITGTAAVSNLPANIEPTCTPYNCPGGLTGENKLPDLEPSRCDAGLPETLTLYLSDMDGNGCVDESDLFRVLLRFGEACEDAEDVNWDGIVDEADLWMVLMDLGSGCEQ